MPSRRTRRSTRKSGGFLDWLFGKKTNTTAPTTSSNSSNIAKAISTGATAPVINEKPSEGEATVIKMNGTTASPSVGGRRRKTHRKGSRNPHRKAHRKAHRKVTKANRKGKSRKNSRK